MSEEHEKMLIKLCAGAGEPKGAGVAGFDKDGPLYHSGTIRKNLIKDINNGNHIKRRDKNMTNDIDSAADIVNKSYERFDFSLNKLMDKQAESAEAVKKASGKVRDSTQKLSDGLSKIEKLANFDRLEKYVLLLERAEVAISSLAELEKSGKLEKIASAVR